jgi:hypothetical protein
MTPKRLFAPTLFVALAVGLAACGTSTGSGAVTSSAPSSGASTAASMAPSAEASAGASAASSAEASGAPSASAAAGGGDLASKIPATVGEVQLSVTTIDGDAYVKANVNRQLSPILTAIGKTPTDVTVATATGSSTGGATLFVDAVQIAGADAAAVQEAFKTAATAVPGNEVTTADMGGKSVVQVKNASYTLVMYASGDTIFFVQSPDADLVTQAVTALP